MDRKSSELARRIVVSSVSAWNSRSEAPLPDVMAWLRSPKNRKFMGKQDILAVVMAGEALREACLIDSTRQLTVHGDRIGIYLSVGYLPFNREEIELISRKSTKASAFDMTSFVEEAMPATNPLLTFRCLPNMPIFHVSQSFGITGSYRISYPGGAQFYQMMEEAVTALEREEIDFALVGGVADQENFLTERRIHKDSALNGLLGIDAAGWLILEKESTAMTRQAKNLFWLRSYDINYLLEEPPQYKETFSVGDTLIEQDALYLGPASLVCRLKAASLSHQNESILTHSVITQDGFMIQSEWERR